ncbi:hypothetical protein HQ865_20910 [Mucilaginibacter mali]|uniref:Uncharacterized protein n=1 Tax=Mucilaginibacter mali TaxID=2740462 RepID=A0A7D4UQ67_9SPHI|nr:hypothetical protein [Mucilaginibacter mali]QKJ32120.1 hypothetical protein HQ865_20910 [Mucilaginibacter mali]
MTNDYDGVACGPGFPLIRLQALATRPVSAAIPNADQPLCPDLPISWRKFKRLVLWAGLTCAYWFAEVYKLPATVTAGYASLNLR